MDTGRWDEALEAAAEAADLAEPTRMDMVAAAADTITATVLALRADSAAARLHAERALAGVDPAESGLIAARAWRALGVAALAEGSHLRAYAQLAPLVQRTGRAGAQHLLLPGRGRFRHRRRPRGPAERGAGRP